MVEGGQGATQAGSRTCQRCGWGAGFGNVNPTVRAYEFFFSFESHCGQEECSSAGDAARISLSDTGEVKP